MFRLFADIFRPKLQSSPTPPSVDEEIKKNADGLAIKRKAALERMGNKWILHPDHYVKNQNIPANSLGFKTS